MKRIATLLGVLLMGAWCAQADSFPDDHADSAVGATALPFNSNQSGLINTHPDRDYFQFTAQPDKQYELRVTPGTLKDATLRIRSSDGSTIAGTAVSVGDAVALLTYPHSPSSASILLEVCGFAKFTTGSYTVRVEESNVVDSDTDGMPDVWENGYFTNLAQVASGDLDGDGLNNLDEYELGYDPTDAGSRFAVTSNTVDQIPRSVTWVSAPFRTYRVESVSSMTDTNWQTLGTVPGNGPESSFSDSGGSADPQRYWRIRYIP